MIRWTSREYNLPSSTKHTERAHAVPIPKLMKSQISNQIRTKKKKEHAAAFGQNHSDTVSRITQKCH